MENIELTEQDAQKIEAESFYTASIADDDDDDNYSETESISSSIYRGYIENGRRYQTIREGEYWGPCDERQFESMQAGHLVYLIADSEEKNTLFRSPIPRLADHILDVGTGNGAWAIDVADKYPDAIVRGVDLYPPPDTWVPENCKFEVDDLLKRWKFPKLFDLVHIRDLFGSFTDRQWNGIHRQAYTNLKPGGWIEQAETGIAFCCDDGSIAPNSLLAQWAPMFTRAAAQADKNINTIDTFKSSISAAGFKNIQERLYKIPLGEWAKHPVLKEAGKFHRLQFMAGMEGYAMYLLTRYGEPEPWTSEKVHVYLANVRKEMENPRVHAYLFKRRVWAQKPMGGIMKAGRE